MSAITMLYALDESDQLIEASKGATGYCPSCRKQLRAKCGDIVIHHWAHIGKDCDSWAESESEWHKQWKESFPSQYREVTMGENKKNKGGKDR